MIKRIRRDLGYHENQYRCLLEFIPGKDGKVLVTFSALPPTPSSCWTVTGAGASTIHGCFSAWLGVKRFFVSQRKQPSKNSRKSGSVHFSALPILLVPGIRFLPREFGTIRGSLLLSKKSFLLVEASITFVGGRPHTP